MDMSIVTIKLDGTLISIDGIGHLIVTRFVQGPEIEPDFSQVRVDANSPRIRVERIVVLTDSIVKDPD